MDIDISYWNSFRKILSNLKDGDIYRKIWFLTHDHDSAIVIFLQLVMFEIIPPRKSCFWQSWHNWQLLSASARGHLKIMSLTSFAVLDNPPFTIKLILAGLDIEVQSKRDIKCIKSSFPPNMTFRFFKILAKSREIMKIS